MNDSMILKLTQIKSTGVNISWEFEEENKVALVQIAPSAPIKTSRALALAMQDACRIYVSLTKEYNCSDISITHEGKTSWLMSDNMTQD
jgi:hypothetical protein